MLKILFIFLLFLLSLGQVGRVELGGGVALLLSDIVVFALVAFWLINKLLTKKPFGKRPLTIPVLLFVASALLSLVVNVGKFPLSEIAIGSLYLLRWLLYAGIYFVVADFPHKIRENIPFWLALAGGVFVTFGFIQYFFYPDLRNLYYLGWDEHLYRMFSTFLDPNFAGGFFVLLFLLIGGETVSSYRKKQRNKMLLLALMGVLTLAAILLTYSRAAFLMLITSSLVFLVLLRKKRYAVVFALLVTFSLLFLPRSFQTEGTNFLRVASAQARIDSLGNALTIIKDHPLFGVGFNAYRYAQREYGFISGENWQITHSGAGTDNSFLFILATTGVVGFASYLYLWFLILRLAIKKRTMLSLVVISSFFGLAIHAFFINSLFYPFIMLWMWILVGLTESNSVTESS